MLAGSGDDDQTGCVADAGAGAGAGGLGGKPDQPGSRQPRHGQRSGAGDNPTDLGEPTGRFAATGGLAMEPLKTHQSQLTAQAIPDARSTPASGLGALQLLLKVGFQADREGQGAAAAITGTKGAERGGAGGIAAIRCAKSAKVRTAPR